MSLSQPVIAELISHWLSWRLWWITALPCGLFCRKHVCVLQPATARQARSDIHHGVSPQRCTCCVFRECLYLSISVPFPRASFFYPERMGTQMFSFLFIADCSKTFRVSLGSDHSLQNTTQLHPLFIPTGQCAHRFTHDTVGHAQIGILLK